MHVENSSTNKVTKIPKADFLRLPPHMKKFDDGPHVFKNVGGGKMAFSRVEII